MKVYKIESTPTISTQVNNFVIDEEGTLRLKETKRIRPQHNNVWSHRENPEKDMKEDGYGETNNVEEQNKGLQHIRKTPQENNGNPPRENNNNIRCTKETK